MESGVVQPSLVPRHSLKTWSSSALWLKIAPPGRGGIRYLGGVGGCGAFTVVQAATTPPRRKQMSIQVKGRGGGKNLRACRRGRWCWAGGCWRGTSSLSPAQARNLSFDLFPHFPKVVGAPIKLSQPKNWCQESVVLTNHAKESLLTNHANQSSPIMAPKAAAPAMAAVVNIRSRSENHTWLTCESKW